MVDSRLLIVGAGALGVITAHHLRGPGAGISFYVRPNRVHGLTRPQLLYAYHKQSVDVLDGYEILSTPGQLDGRAFDFVLLTPDGSACRSAEGVSLLQTLGKAVGSSDAKLLICSVGHGLFEHVRMHTGLSDDRILEGTMVSFSYQVGRGDTPHPGRNQRAMHDSCDFAYLDFANKRGFMIAGARAPARQFAGLFNRNSGLNCFRMPRKLVRSTTSAYVAFTVACELAHWKCLDAVIDNSGLWHLSCQAQREIFSLGQHGLAGRLMALVMTDARQARMTRDVERDAAAMGFMDFFRFHHGGKVRQQNIQGLENAVAAGQAQGRAMPACVELLARCAKGAIPSPELAG